MHGLLREEWVCDGFEAVEAGGESYVRHGGGGVSVSGSGSGSGSGGGGGSSSGSGAGTGRASGAGASGEEWRAAAWDGQPALPAGECLKTTVTFHANPLTYNGHFSLPAAPLDLRAALADGADGTASTVVRAPRTTASLASTFLLRGRVGRGSSGPLRSLGARLLLRVEFVTLLPEVFKLLLPPRTLDRSTRVTLQLPRSRKDDAERGSSGSGALSASAVR